jgi:hypothetical protein
MSDLLNEPLSATAQAVADALVEAEGAAGFGLAIISLNQIILPDYFYIK